MLRRPLAAPVGAARSLASVAPSAVSLKAVAAPEPPHEFLDLRGLVERLRQELPARPSIGAPIDGEVVARVIEFLEQTKLNPREWQQHANFRRGRYTRNIIGYSPNQFIALLLCWGRGQQSPIHDHAGAHCFVKMMAGRLVEQRFAWSELGHAGTEVMQETTMDASTPGGTVSFMHNSLGLHRIINPSTDEVAISLHVYSPPFAECLVFPPTGGPPKVGNMVSVFAPMPSAGAATASQDKGFDETAPSLSDLCNSLGELAKKTGEARPDSFEVLDLLSPVELGPLEWAACASPAHFSEFGVVQHIVHCDDDFSVIVSCWSPGQKVQPHTIGRGRKMWMKVVHGNLRFEEFAPGLFAWEADVEHKALLAEGSSSILEECGVRVHRFENPSDTEPAVCVQIFSPPLTQFTYQTENGLVRRDVPALLGYGSAPGTVTASGASMRGLMRTAGRWYLSFRGLVGLLDEELARPAPLDSAITALLRKAVFNVEEWRSLGRSLAPEAGGAEVTGPRSVMVSQRPKYSLVLRFWGHGAAPSAAREPKGSRSWTLILEGELQEDCFGEGGEPERLMRSSTLKEESLTFLDGSAELLRSLNSDQPCVSLHLYSPALPVACLP